MKMKERPMVMKGPRPTLPPYNGTPMPLGTAIKNIVHTLIYR